MKFVNAEMFKAVIVLLSIVVFGILVQACGEDENPCEKARNIQKRICRESNSEKCFPCPCILRGQDYTFTTDDFGLPDASRSSCKKSEPCEELKFLWAGGCIADEQTCDPRYYKDIKMFDNGEPSPAFHDICYGDW